MIINQNMESNISKDHIALEAMKVMLTKSVEIKRSRFKENDDWFLPTHEEIAVAAYDYAEAMIAERERRSSINDGNG